MTTFDTCAAIEGSDSEGIVGSALVFNNWLYDCANAAGDNGSLASVGGLSGTAGNPDLDNNFAAQAAAAVTDEALDWAAINAAYPESVADVDYLDSTRYIGAVNPLSSTLPWWAGWTIEGSLGTAPSAPEATCPAGAPANADGLCVLPIKDPSPQRQRTWCPFHKSDMADHPGCTPLQNLINYRPWPLR